MNPELIKTYRGAAAINPSRFVKFGAADGDVIQAVDSSASIVGISAERVDVASGENVDVIKSGIAFLKLGGSVARGEYIRPDANGKGVAVTVTAGVPVFFGAKAEVSGVDGDIIPVEVINGCIGDTGIITAEVTITSAELLALNATPKTLVAAPGAGLAIVPIDVQLFLDYNSAAYAGIAAGENLEVRATNGSGQLFATVESDGLLDATADQYRHIYPLAAAASTPVANAALIMCLASGEVTTGNSPIKVRTRYRVCATSW
jgi:hypothetical protein